MYAGRVACCPLVSHVEYGPRALLRLEKGAMLTLEKKRRHRQNRPQTDGRSDRQTLDHYIAINARRGQHNNNNEQRQNQSAYCSFTPVLHLIVQTNPTAPCSHEHDENSQTEYFWHNLLSCR